MRLLGTDKLKIEEFGFDQIPKYAILSHRWGKYELTLQDVQGRIWTKEEFSNEGAKVEALKKIQQCCLKAQSDSFQYVWVDSCCIDKTSSTELSEAINSMYLWYYKAAKCYAYLADVQSISGFKNSEWFMRGWTLQELLAPPEVYFVNRDWKDLGTKTTLGQEISDQTRIPVSILSGADLETASIAQRMSWASHRKTSRVEDRAYCLMGIFCINMPLLYGEGERAFIRLQEEIMKISDDHSLFAWRSSDIRGGLLATSPDAFFGSHKIVQYNPFDDLSGPLTVSSRGVHLELRFIGRGPNGLGMAVLPCRVRDMEDMSVVIHLRDTTLAMELFERVWSEKLEYIDLRKLRSSQSSIRKICIRMGRMSITNKIESSEIQRGAMKEDYSEVSPKYLIYSTGNVSKEYELFEAARMGDYNRVWFLLTRNDIKADLRDEKGLTALCHAVINNRKTLTKILLSRRDVNIEHKDNNGCTPLLLAARHDHESIAKLLLKRGANTEERDGHSTTPLLQAVENNCDGIVKLLVDNGADIEVKDAYDGTPLMLAIENKHEGIVKLLVENGAKLEVKDVYDETPLVQAVENKCEGIVRLLVENGADIGVKDNNGYTPLMLAIENKCEGIVKLLVEKGADTP